jgi:hypothetical protein
MSRIVEKYIPFQRGQGACVPDIRVCGCNSYHGHGDLLEELWVLEGEGGGWKKKEIKRCKEGWRS